MSTLHLVPIYCGTHAEMIPRLAGVLEQTFHLTVERHPPAFDPELAFDASRGQYNSRLLLTELVKQAPDNGGRILGVTSVDLFIPVLTFVFGEAQLNGPAAVVSTHRLAAEVYGLSEQPELLFDRLCKEAVHELGHTYQLVHCPDDYCVMRSSQYVENIDLKSAGFCHECRASVHPSGARR
ncbi:MAG: archaemetzincin family Zn-dependent metalloprotease [Acidobacteriota bacterium]